VPAKPTTPIPRCVFICSPFSADNDADLFRNIEYAQDASKDAIDRGESPYTPHLFLTQILKDGDQAQRDLSLELAKRWLRRCDGLAVYIDYGVSAGMKGEIAAATAAHIPIWYRGLHDDYSDEPEDDSTDESPKDD